MKKNIVLITVAICLIIAGAALVGAALVAADFSLSGLASEKFEEVTHTVDGDFEHIMISTDIHNVTLVPSPDSVCRIVGSESENLEIGFEIENNTLVVKIKDDRKWYDHIGMFTMSEKITVYLPREQYAALSIHRSTGDVKIPSNFKFESISITGSNG